MQKCARLILASASPRRSELLRNAGVDFIVNPSSIEEKMLATESPLEYAQRLACDKARYVHQRFPTHPVLGADTVVVIDGNVLEKPADAQDASRMLRLLSGRSHLVITGVCLIGSNDGHSFEDVRSATTEVFFRHLDEKEIREYVASGEPMDKAGAYGIQGRASRWIPKIMGCYFNVVGLPVALVTQILQEHGLL